MSPRKAGLCAYDITKDWTLQAAWVGAVEGKNALRERGFSLGV